MQKRARLQREVTLLETSPPHGVSCWLEADQCDKLKAKIVGGTGTPYARGVFELEITVPERYPFEPPQIRFLTPIYHPNIDDAGRICLDLLKLPPHGAWKPSLNIASLLMSIQLLMAEPNPDDGLMADIASEYKQNRPIFKQKATAHTEKYARDTGHAHHDTSSTTTRTSGKRKANCDDAVTDASDMHPYKHWKKDGRTDTDLPA